MSTAKQDLERQLHALAAVGIPTEATFVEKKSGSTPRPGPGCAGCSRNARAAEL